jgi:hypothetical protein
MGDAVTTGVGIWTGLSLLLFSMALSLWGLVAGIRRARRGERSVLAALLASLVTGAHVGFFLALLPGSDGVNFQLTERLAILILFVALCGLPTGWLLAAIQPFWRRSR